MKRLLFVFVIVNFLLTGCGAGKSRDAATNATSEDIAPSDSLDNIGAAVDSGYRRLTAEEAKRIIDGEEPYILLDVRTEVEYSQTRIDGAVLIPNTEIGARAPEELPDKEATILVYCRSGARSAAASETLAQMGYIHVYDFGGIINWPYETVSG